jgi:hypothetical protein
MRRGRTGTAGIRVSLRRAHAALERFVQCSPVLLGKNRAQLIGNPLDGTRLVPFHARIGAAQRSDALFFDLGQGDVFIALLPGGGQRLRRLRQLRFKLRNLGLPRLHERRQPGAVGLIRALLGEEFGIRVGHGVMESAQLNAHLRFVSRGGPPRRQGFQAR